MPDWSYHPLKKLILNKMSPKTSRECIHVSMNTIASVPGGRNLIDFLGHMKPPPEFQKTIHHTSFLSPIGLSGMIDPNLSGMKAFQELSFGFLEIGPIVLDEPLIQGEPIRKNSRILFPENHEKVSLKRAINKLTITKLRIPVFARIDAGVKGHEWDLILQHLTPFVDAFIATEEQIRTHLKQGKLNSRTFYTSFSADVSEKIDIETLKRNPSFGGIVLHAPHHIEEGYWHDAMHANERLTKVVQQMKDTHPDITVITSGGVETPEEAHSLFQAGADLLMLTDGYIKAGPGLPKRIYERLLCNESKPNINQGWFWSLLFGLSILAGGMIALYFAFTSIILPYDESFIGLTKAELSLINPLILSFMSHDRMALAGTMISGGILYIQLARHGIKYSLHWAKVAFHSAAITGFLGIFLFIGFGYFDWLHGLYWLILLPIYYFSFKEGKRVTGSPCSHHGTNDRRWQLGLYGQLLFIILGFSNITGGIIISTIGVSNVFVSTDVSYLCMTPEMLDSISTNLIPVIAHDRAGFGSSLVSVGLLVLMLSLWGFRKGERWVWNTLAIGALPAFIAGLGTHMYIGYTAFIHLLPLYFLCVLYVSGLILSYPYLKKG